MSLSRYLYDPFHDPFFTIESEFSRMFDAAWDGRAPGSGARDVQRHDDSRRSLRPRMDLHESKDRNEMTATFELPGMKKEDVTIDVQNGRLVVAGQSAISSALESEGYALRERRFGRFARTVPLPAGTKAEEITARMEEGILTVTFPRTQAEQEAQRIAIL